MAEYIGRQAGQLTVVEDLGVFGAKRKQKRMLRCIYACGNEATITVSKLNAGRAKSCGCLLEPPRKHRRQHEHVRS